MTALATDREVTLPVIGRIDRSRPLEQVAADLAHAARLVRRRDLVMVHEAGQGHIGGDLSVIDILVTLYLAAMDYDPTQPLDPQRDRLVLSKGHAAGALYTTLAALGVLDPRDLATFMAPQSKLNGHPDRNKVPGVEANTGPLGHGLPIATGIALSGKLDGSPRRTFVIVGDGELQEGSNWEAMMTASQYRLDRLVAIVDRNHLQQGDTTEHTNDLSPLGDKARAFGWNVQEVDGHDHAALLRLFEGVPQVPGRPTFVIAHTHKGQPISFMRDNVAWHHKVPGAAELELALAELEDR